MLMTKLRKNMKKVLWVTLILIIPSFIAWGVGSRARGRQKNIVAKVNRRSITTKEYAAVLNRYYEYYREIYKEDFTEEVARKLKFREKVLKDLIKDILLSYEVKRNRITVVRPEDIEKKIKENAFFKDAEGKFDPEKYNFYLNAWRPTVWNSLKASTRDELIKEELNQRIKDSFKVTDEEIYDEFIREYELVKVEYIRFRPSTYTDKIKPADEDIKAFYEEHKTEFEKPRSVNIEYIAIRPEDLKKEIKITDEEIKKYYEGHEDEFHKPEEIRCRHVLMRTPPDASPEKKQKILKQFDFMMGKYKEDVTFETLARVYSEDYNTRADGGDLGYFSRGTMPPEFEETAFKLKPGEVSKVVRTGQGYHLIKLEDRKAPYDESLEEASPEIKEKLLNEKGKTGAEKKAKEIYDGVYDVETLIEASEKYNIPLEESGFFAMGEEVKGLGRSYKIWQTAFKLEEEEISELIEAPQGYTIFKLKEKKPSYIPGFEDIKEDAGKRFKEKKAGEMAKKEAEKCLKKLQTGEDFKKTAKEFRVEIRSPEPFNREGYLKNVDSSPDFGRVCFNLKKGECGGVVEARQGFYIFKLVERLPPQDSEFEKVKNQLKDRLLQQKIYSLYEEWYDHLNKKAKIKTYL
jgi:peptidyl-prolyl cis-trans isomerase D